MPAAEAGPAELAVPADDGARGNGLGVDARDVASGAERSRAHRARRVHG